MSYAIKRNNGTVAYVAEHATSAREAAEAAVKDGANLIGANLIGANLAEADLVGAHLFGANLTQANLIGANLTDADLAGANLTGADIYWANLAGANLTGANLYRAELSGAKLTRVNLRGANLTGANQREAKGIVHVGPVDGWDMYAVRWPDGPRIKAGCRWFTVGEAREWWEKGGEPSNAPGHGPLMLAGVEALVALARAHGWEMGETQA